MNDKSRNPYCQNPTVKVRDYFLDYPDVSTYSQKLSRHLMISAGAAHGALKDLFERGLLKREQQGRTLVYHLDRQAPTVRALKISRSIELATGLAERLSPHIRELYLLGSAAAGEYSSRSHLDIAVVVDEGAEVKAVREVIGSYPAPRKIRSLILTLRQWQELKNRNPVRFLKITRGIKLYSSHSGAKI